MSILCFLTFNVSAMLGSLTTSWIQWVRNENVLETMFDYNSLYTIDECVLF